jgi:hypothetical protein
VDAAIAAKTPATLPEIGTNAVKLPPTNCDFVTVCRVNGYRRLVCSIANDVIAI